VLPQLAISEHFTVNLHKSLIGALSFNFARHRQLWQHPVTSWRSCPPSRADHVSQRFYSYCPVVVRVSLCRLCVGKKIKTPKSGRKKIKFFFGLMKKILSCNFWLQRWSVRIARVYFFEDRHFYSNNVGGFNTASNSVKLSGCNCSNSFCGTFM